MIAPQAPGSCGDSGSDRGKQSALSGKFICVRCERRQAGRSNGSTLTGEVGLYYQEAGEGAEHGDGQDFQIIRAAGLNDGGAGERAEHGADAANGGGEGYARCAHLGGIDVSAQNVHGGLEGVDE